MMVTTTPKKRSRRAIVATPAPIQIKVTPDVQGAKKRKKRNRTRRQRIPVVPSSVIKPCSIRYMKALLDPWGSRNEEELPCVPDIYDFPTAKFYTRAKGLFVTSTAAGGGGFGFIIAMPLNISNDLVKVQTSNLTYAAFSPGGGGSTNITNSQSPYINAAAPSYRCVAEGLRIRYTGTELARGGRILLAKTPTSADSFVGLTYDQIASRTTTDSVPVDRKWHGVVFIPGVPNDYGFFNANNTVFRECILVQAADPTVSLPFEWELVSYYETIPSGGDNTLGQTRSHSDLPGLSLVRDFVGGLSASKVGQAAVQAGLHYIKQSVFGPATPLLEYGAESLGRVSIKEML